MTYVIAQPDIDILGRPSADELACAHKGNCARYVDLDECVDGEAYERLCPVEGIYYEEDVPERWSTFPANNAAFFAEPLPGAVIALTFAGGAVELGVLGVGAERVAASYPFREP